MGPLVLKPSSTEVPGKIRTEGIATAFDIHANICGSHAVAPMTPRVKVAVWGSIQKLKYDIAIQV